MAIKLEADNKYPQVIIDHLRNSMKKRKMTLGEIIQMRSWKQGKVVPDLTEAPLGWFKRFPSFTLLGEGKYIKTVYTRHMEETGGLTPRRPGIVNWDVWYPQYLKQGGQEKLSKLLDRILASSWDVLL